MFSNNSSFPTRPTTILDTNLQAMSKAVDFAPLPTVMDSPESVTTDDDSSSQEDIPCSHVTFRRRTKQELDDLIDSLFDTDPTYDKKNKEDKEHTIKRKREDDREINVQDKDTNKRRGILTTKKSASSMQPALKQVRRVSFTDKEDAIWTGYVELSRRIKFQATARQIGGRRLNMSEWNNVMSPTLAIEGRIHVDVVDDYVTKIHHAFTARHEVVLVLLEPTQATDDNVKEANTLVHYLDSRQRLGVIGQQNMTSVKDFYLMPLSEYQQLPDFLYVVRMDEEKVKHQGNVFIGIIVIQKPAPTTSSLRRPSCSQQV